MCICPGWISDLKPRSKFQLRVQSLEELKQQSAICFMSFCRKLKDNSNAIIIAIQKHTLAHASEDKPPAMWLFRKILIVTQKNWFPHKKPQTENKKRGFRDDMLNRGHEIWHQSKQCTRFTGNPPKITGNICRIVWSHQNESHLISWPWPLLFNSWTPPGCITNPFCPLSAGGPGAIPITMFPGNIAPGALPNSRIVWNKKQRTQPPRCPKSYLKIVIYLWMFDAFQWNFQATNECVFLKFTQYPTFFVRSRSWRFPSLCSLSFPAGANMTRASHQRRPPLTYKQRSFAIGRSKNLK